MLLFRLQVELLLQHEGEELHQCLNYSHSTRKSPQTILGSSLHEHALGLHLFPSPPLVLYIAGAIRCALTAAGLICRLHRVIRQVSGRNHHDN